MRNALVACFWVVATAAVVAAGSASGCRKEAPVSGPGPAAEAVPVTGAEGANLAVQPASAPLDVDDPSTCAPCHQAVVDEWSRSMHSQAHHDRDPFYGSMRALRMKKQGAQVADECAQCHTPRSVADHDSAAAQTGVSCAACHAVAEIHAGAIGARAFRYDDSGVLRSARDIAPGVASAHGTGPALAQMADGVSACMPCHDALSGSGDQPLCATGPEYRDGGSEQTCVGCHMPEKAGAAGTVGRQDRHRSHEFFGPYHAFRHGDTAFSASGVDVRATWDEQGLHVELQNRTGHAYPSGFPGRMALVKIIAKDAAGTPVWSNFDADPMGDSPQSVLNKVYHDAEGKPVPAALAVRLVRDSRLKPGETRTVNYAVPAQAASAEVRLLYRLLPPPLAQTLGLEQHALAQAKLIRRIEVKRPPAAE